jgi:hypothetical protein
MNPLVKAQNSSRTVHAEKLKPAENVHILARSLASIPHNPPKRSPGLAKPKQLSMCDVCHDFTLL